MSTARWTLFAATGLLLLVNHGTARATEYPYCMSYVEGWAGMIERCDFSTIDQCRASASGLNGSCAPNWRLAYRNQNADPIDRVPASGKRVRQ